jgi:hypothetical protein
MNSRQARSLFRLRRALAHGSKWLILILVPPLLLSGSAAAALEEFENWSVGARELDDENGLDALLRSFSPWDDWRWRENLQGARVGMGCATTQFWEVNLEVKMLRQVSDRVLVGFRSWQQAELGESVSWNEFSGGFRPVGRWWVGGTYRPSFEKEQHDAGLFVGYKRDWMSWVRLHLGFEDVLNNFWDDRTRYIEDKGRRVYISQPREWELRGMWREQGLGAVAVRGVVLPHYQRTFETAPSDPAPSTDRQLTGWLLRTDLVSDPLRRTVLGFRSRLKGTDRSQAWGQYRLSERWRFRAIGHARWSNETHFDGTRDHHIDIEQYGGMATVVWSTWRFLDIEVGVAAERVNVDQDAGPRFSYFTHGTRGESRAIIALDLHWNGARLILIESLEGNDEGYQTTGYHDKGFAQLVIEF